MSYRIQQHANEAIFVLSIIGGFETRDVERALTDQVGQAAYDVSSQVVRIIDARYMDQSYMPWMLRLIENLRKEANVQHGPCPQVVLVGRPELITLTRAKDNLLPMFTSLEKALSYAQAEQVQQISPSAIRGAGEVYQ